MSSPLVSIIVTSYCPESKPYLDLCMKSIRNLSYNNIETIIVGRPDYLPEYAGAQSISPPTANFWNGAGINFGVDHARGDYFFIINDDVILTSDCIEPLLIEGLNVMPIGNDQQGRYHFPELLRDKADMDLAKEDFEAFPLQGFSRKPGLIFADTLCLYAHMVSRKLWNDVGPMDDNAGLIDIDWCLRVRQKGYQNAMSLSSLVWHFGGSSVTHTLDGPKRIKQKEQFKAKWGWCP